MKSVLSFATLLAVVCAAPAWAQNGAAPAAAAPRPTFAVIDVGNVFKNHNRFQAQLNAIKGEIKQFEDFVGGEQKKIQQDVEKLKEFKQGSNEFKQGEERIARVQTELKLAMGRKRDEFLKKEADAYFAAFQDVEQHTRHIAERNGITLVLRHSIEQIDPSQRDSILKGINRTIIHHAGYDLTQHVTDSINRQTPPPTTGAPAAAPPGTATRPATGGAVPPRRQ